MFQIVVSILFLFAFVIWNSRALRYLYSLTFFVVIQVLVQYYRRISGPLKFVKAIIHLSFTLEVPDSDLSWNTDYPEWGFSGFSQSFQVNAEIIPQARPQPLPSISFLIHYYHPIIWCYMVWATDCIIE
jgi:hypothetical protein